LYARKVVGRVPSGLTYWAVSSFVVELRAQMADSIYPLLVVIGGDNGSVCSTFEKRIVLELPVPIVALESWLDAPT